MKSMTGYGAAAGRAGDVSLTVEVRSVNQRFFDLKLNAPREYMAWEADLRRSVAAEVARGRVELWIGRNARARGGGVVVQEDVARAYVEAWRGLQKRFGLAGEIDLSLLAGRGDIFAAVEPAADPEAEVEVVQALLAKALRGHTRTRKAEGRHLARDMKERVARLRAIRREMAGRAEQLVPALRERLEKRLGDLLASANIEPARLAQETAILADRADITEELVRLEAHLVALRDMLVEAGEPVGKRLDFVLQEVNRELNTIGSKASDLAMTNLVVDGKAEVEKLREQVQNVE